MHRCEALAQDACCNEESRGCAWSPPHGGCVAREHFCGGDVDGECPAGRECVFAERVALCSECGGDMGGGGTVRVGYCVLADRAPCSACSSLCLP